MNKLFFERTLLFFISLTIVTVTFLFLTYHFLVKNYKDIEHAQNIRNINTLLISIKNNMSYMDRIATDTNLSKYQNIPVLFIIDNKLKNLKVDFIIVEKNEKKRYSKYTQEKIPYPQNFENFVIQKLSKSDNQTTILNYLEHLVIVSRKNDIYMGRVLTQEDLKSLSETFITIRNAKQLINTAVKSTPIQTQYFDNVIVKTIYNDDKKYLNNNIQFFDKENHFLFAIGTSNKRDMVEEGKSSLIIFIAIVLIFLCIIFLITFRYQSTIKKTNNSLELQVDTRTKQIQNTLKELEKVNSKLYDLAHTDFLTKTRNRRNFFIHSQTIFNDAINHDKPLSMLMIDIDNFKKFNDIYGHDLGDKVLILFAECIKRNIKEDYIFGRLGGEEFAITLPNTPLNIAIEEAERLRKAIEHLQIATSSKTLTVTASFGASDIRNCKDIDHLLQKADNMLYSAKRSGKNIVRSRLTTI